MSNISYVVNWRSRIWTRLMNTSLQMKTGSNIYEGNRSANSYVRTWVVVTWPGQLLLLLSSVWRNFKGALQSPVMLRSAMQIIFKVLYKVVLWHCYATEGNVKSCVTASEQQQVWAKLVAAGAWWLLHSRLTGSSYVDHQLCCWPVVYLVCSWTASCVLVLLIRSELSCYVD